MAAPARQLRPQPASAAQLATPANRRRELLERYGPLLLLALWTLVVTAILARLGGDSRHVFRDESNAVLLGRLIEQDPGQAFSGSVARGPERLTSWLAALAAVASDSPTRQYELLHYANALFQGLVVVPVWLAARQLGLDRWRALVPATVATAGSFASYGIFTLNTSVGLLCASLMLWAMLRALRRPGIVSDLLVATTLGATVLGRIGWAPLVAALVPAVLATSWFGRAAGEPAGAWLRALPRRLLRSHPLLVPLGAAIVLAALVKGPDELLGGELYGGVRLTPQWELSMLWDNTRLLLTHLALGVALVPFVLALPVLVRGLGRPASPIEGGLAWLVLGYLAIFSYAYYASMNEDRYFAVLVAPLVLAGALAVFGRPPALWAVAVSGVAAAALVATSYEWPTADVFTYFVAPTSRFFTDIVVGKLDRVVPLGSGTTAALVVLGAGAVALLLVAVARRLLPRRASLLAGGAVLAGLLAVQLVTMEHPARKFTQAVGMTFYGPQALQFVDAAVAGDDSEPLAIGRAEPLSVDGAINPDLAGQMGFLQVFNSSLGYAFLVVRDVGDGAPLPPAEARVDWRTGAVAVGGNAPEVLLTRAGQATVAFAGEPLPGPPHFPWAELQRLDMPLRTTWILRGDLPDRFADRGRPMQVRVFPGGTGGLCLGGRVVVHPLTDRPVRYRLAGGGRTLRGTLRPGGSRQFALRVPSRPTTFSLRGEAGRLADGTWRAPALFDVSVAPCAR